MSDGEREQGRRGEERNGKVGEEWHKFPTAL